MKDIKDRIKEIAVENCGDYPNIANVSSFEQLWAIESTLKGIGEANEECHKMIKILAGKCNLSLDDVVSLWEKME